MPYSVENIVRKGEIACYKQFLLSHNVFHSYISSVHQNALLCGNGLTLSQTGPGFNISIENTIGKEKIARNKKFQQFLDFLWCFYPFEELSAIFIKFEIAICKLFLSGGVHKLSFGKGLNPVFVEVKQI